MTCSLLSVSEWDVFLLTLSCLLKFFFGLDLGTKSELGPSSREKECNSWEAV